MLSFQIITTMRRQTKWQKYLSNIHLQRSPLSVTQLPLSCQTSMNKPAFQLLAWLRMLVLTRSKRCGIYPRSVKPWEMSSCCTSFFLTGASLPVWWASSRPVRCSYWNSPWTGLWRWSILSQANSCTAFVFTEVCLSNKISIKNASNCRRQTQFHERQSSNCQWWFLEVNST